MQLAPESPSEWIENRPTRGRRALDVREVWRYRDLIAIFALRDLKVRYRQAIFGVAWALVQPLAAVGIYTVIFGNVANISTGKTPYALFAFVGSTVWTYYSTGLTAVSTSLVRNANLISKVYFPRATAPLAALIPGVVDLMIGWVLLLPIFLVAFDTAPTPQLVLLPLCIVPLLLVTLGVGLLVGTLNVRYRDAGYALTLLTQLWLFASPIVYPAANVPGRWRYLYDVNPMVGVIDLHRFAMVGASFPGRELAIGMPVALALLGWGVVYFASAERRFADVI